MRNLPLEMKLRSIRIHRKTFHVFRWILFILMVLLLGGTLFQLAAQILPRESLMRQWLAFLERRAQTETLTPFACAQSPVTADADRALLMKMVEHPLESAQRARIFCFLGDHPNALAAYWTAAETGDPDAALQAHYLLAKTGQTEIAQQILLGKALSLDALNQFFYGVGKADPDFALMPIARRTVELYPSNSLSWQMWIDAARQSEKQKDWPAALSAYTEAISLQEHFGVSTGRSSFLLKRGRIYQAYLTPPDPAKALIDFKQALVKDNYMVPSDKVTIHLYIAGIYRTLSTQYTFQQVLAEYQTALTLSPSNYSIILSIADYYITVIKNYTSAQLYIDQAVREHPELPNAYLTQGDLYQRMGDLPQAAAAYQKALAVSPNWKSAQDRLAAVKKLLEQKTP